MFWHCDRGLSENPNMAEVHLYHLSANYVIHKNLLTDQTTLTRREEIPGIGTFEIWLVVVSKKNMNRYFGRLPTDPKSKPGPKLWNIGDIFAAPVKPAAGSLREAGGAVRGGDSWLALHHYSSTVEFWLSQKYVQLKVEGPCGSDF